MIAKKYFSALILFITLLGFYQEQTPVPNQQIELQFSGSATVSSNTEEVIEAIKLQLEDLGVANIQVRKQADNTLTIAYYSNENAASVKKLLIEKGIASKDKFPASPTENNTVNYQEFASLDSYELDVYELQTTSDSFDGTHGKYILDLQKEYDKSPTPNSFAKANSLITGDFNTSLIARMYTESGYTTILKENISYEIPDVRAGPFTTTLS
ncbi:MAG: hypothetical protein AB8B65_00245 [Kordia sp.]|uniref:hypothetical protein n=1 Tax=Kordia sp. TaxID=1965332 RepID=UPI00385DF853